MVLSEDRNSPLGLDDLVCLLHQLVVDDFVLGLIGGIHEEDVLLFRSHRSHSATGHVGGTTSKCIREMYLFVLTTYGLFHS